MFKNTFLLGAIFLCLGEAALSSERKLVESDKSIIPCNNCHGGCNGSPGRDGRDGRDSVVPGHPGRPGSMGRPGRVGPPGRPGVASGTVYTRWGRNICPHTSKIVYQGVMGGSHYTHPGGGSNYLCLPKNPIYQKVKAGNQGSTYIYGTEYELNKQTNIFPKNVHDHDAPCAVCHTESRGSHLMIPARNVCPAGWVLEYKGYLMAEHYNHKGRTQYICVDGNPSGTHGSHANLNGALLYFVEGQCGSLPCPPYVTGNELTCAVCTK